MSSAARTAFAQDQPGDVTLAWVRGDRADTCPSQSEIAREVTLRVGHTPFGEGGQIIETVVRREGMQWQARIFVRDERGVLVGTRDLTSDELSCTAIAESAALAIALVIDPIAAARASAVSSSFPPPGTSSAPPASSSPPPVASTATSHRESPELPATSTRAVPRRRAETRFAAATGVLRATVSAGLLPTAAIGVGVRIDRTIIGRLRGTVGIDVLPEIRSTNNGADLAFGMWAASLGMCIEALRTVSVRFSGCAALMAGAIHAVVFAPVPAEPGERPWLATSVGVNLAVRLTGPLFIEASVDAIVPIVRYRAFVEGHTSPAFEQSVVTAVGSVGLGLAF